MSGVWEPYLLSIRDEITIDAIEDREKVKSCYYSLRRKMDDLITTYKGNKTPPSMAAAESDMKQVATMFGGDVSDYRDNQNFLHDARDLAVEYFRELTGKDPVPFKPVGPKEMFHRNLANVEWSCTALYYIPAPDEDVILCLSSEKDEDGYSMYFCPHYRDKNTGELIGCRFLDKADLTGRDWHPVKLDYTRSNLWKDLLND